MHAGDPGPQVQLVYIFEVKMVRPSLHTVQVHVWSPKSAPSTRFSIMRWCSVPIYRPIGGV